MDVGKLARNERVKLRALSINAVGVAFVAVGAIQPVVVGEVTAVVLAKVAICALIGYILHRYALFWLGKLED